MTGSAPEVAGCLSPGGAFNDPAAVYCRLTGVRLGANRTQRVVRAERPSVAVIVWDDGTSGAISSSLTVGSATGNDVVLVDPARSVSRRHAVVELDQWSTLVRDLGSTNGTFVSAATASTWRRLEPGAAFTVRSGDRFAFGRRWCTIRLLNGGGARLATDVTR